MFLKDISPYYDDEEALLMFRFYKLFALLVEKKLITEDEAEEIFKEPKVKKDESS